MADKSNLPGDAVTAAHEADPTAEAVERRAVLRRFGAYAAFTAPALTVLMASRQSEAGGFSRNSNRDGASHGGSSGGGGCGFSC